MASPRPSTVPAQSVREVLSLVQALLQSVLALVERMNLDDPVVQREQARLQEMAVFAGIADAPVVDEAPGIDAAEAPHAV